jgi:hypothetical protein
LTGKPPVDGPTHGDIRQGFVYDRAPHITLKSIANNAEIDTIWEGYQQKLEPLREAINAALGTDWQEWEIPRELTAAQAQIPVRPEPVEGHREGESAGSRASTSSARTVESHEDGSARRVNQYSVRPELVEGRAPRIEGRR